MDCYRINVKFKIFEVTDLFNKKIRIKYNAAHCFSTTDQITELKWPHRNDQPRLYSSLRSVSCIDWQRCFCCSFRSSALGCRVSQVPEVGNNKGSSRLVLKALATLHAGTICNITWLWTRLSVEALALEHGPSRLILLLRVPVLERWSISSLAIK